MIKESRHIDFSTTGRQPSEKDFARISAWIQKHKNKQGNTTAENLKRRTLPGSSKGSIKE